MTTAIQRNAYRICPVCIHYGRRRAAALEAAIAFRALIRGVSPGVVAHEYLSRVHARHVAGGTLSTRKFTGTIEHEDGSKTLHVQRHCNGCGESVGDVTEAELDAAVCGAPLPDVRLECGCIDVPMAAYQMLRPEEIDKGFGLPTGRPLSPGVQARVAAGLTRYAANLDRSTE
ncbi:hypothetical protein KVF89_22605 [Nocardioides carbamazepini]|uniref:hypothetical protein n=1 Tax=Nocardioides carbamazepini TaxID=2854259 RepID=UPI002149BB4F|nr:hypothetical protein [Nocardioides carbamazepini]MCR1785349.1 hypothetical protein [Nocardioides carbamazepini]